MTVLPTAQACTSVLCRVRLPLHTISSGSVTRFHVFPSLLPVFFFRIFPTVELVIYLEAMGGACPSGRRHASRQHRRR